MNILTKCKLIVKERKNSRDYTFKQWEMKYIIGLSWLLLFIHVLDKCSTVCEVASVLTPREAGIPVQRFSFLKLNSAYLPVFD